MTNRVAVLVDADNVFKTEYLDSGIGAVTHEINRFVALGLRMDSATREISIRFYGGWKTENVFTNRASRLQQVIGSIPLFPFRHPTMGIIRGSVTLATSLIVEPSLVWETTFKVHAGLRRVRLAEAPCFETCSRTSVECPVRQFVKFTKKSGKSCPAEGCSVKNEDVFKAAEQKMVDTMIACDLLSLSVDNSVSAVGVLSEDSDLLPAIIQARHFVKYANHIQKHILVYPRRSYLYPQSMDLESRGIETIYWEDLENAD